MIYRKLAARCITHEISEVQHWQRYAVTQVLLDRYQRERDDFLGRIVAMDETWARSYEPILKSQSNEWKHAGSRPKKVRPIQFIVKVKFIVAYDIDGVILHHAVLPRQTVNAAYVHSSGENDDTWWYRTPSFFMTMQGVTPLLLSRSSCAAGDGRLWNIHRTHPIWVHTIAICSSKWNNHCEGPGTTQEMNVSVL